MRKEIKADMEARIDSLMERTESNITQESSFARAEIENIKAEAQRESDRLDREEAATFTYDLYQSYIKSGFTEEQAWALVQIIMSNASRPKLF